MTATCPYEHGQVLFLRPLPDDRVGAFIVWADQATDGSHVYSHAGVVVNHAGDVPASPYFMEMRGHDALRVHVIGPEVMARHPLAKKHPLGADAATAVQSLRSGSIEYGMLHVVLAGVAAVLRNHGHGGLNREVVWEFIHRFSRKLCGVQTCKHERGKHEVPKATLPRLTCAAFVDVAFRAGQACLCVREPESDAGRALALGDACEVLQAIAGLIPHSAIDVPALTGLPSSARRASVDADGAAATALDVRRDPVDVRTPLDFPLLVDELFANGGTIRADPLARRLAELLALLVGELWWQALRQRLRFRPRPPVAPRPGEPMWPPFMSLQLLMDALEPLPTCPSPPP